MTKNELIERNRQLGKLDYGELKQAFMTSMLAAMGEHEEYLHNIQPGQKKSCAFTFKSAEGDIYTFKKDLDCKF